MSKEKEKNYNKNAAARIRSNGYGISNNNGKIYVRPIEKNGRVPAADIRRILKIGKYDADVKPIGKGKYVEVEIKGKKGK